MDLSASDLLPSCSVRAGVAAGSLQRAASAAHRRLACGSTRVVVLVANGRCAEKAGRSDLSREIARGPGNGSSQRLRPAQSQTARRGPGQPDRALRRGSPDPEAAKGSASSPTLIILTKASWTNCRYEGQGQLQKESGASWLVRQRAGLRLLTHPWLPTSILSCSPRTVMSAARMATLPRCPNCSQRGGPPDAHRQPAEVRQRVIVQPPARRTVQRPRID